MDLISKYDGGEIDNISNGPCCPECKGPLDPQNYCIDPDCTYYDLQVVIIDLTERSQTWELAQ